MANPAAPREANDTTGAKLLYGIHDVSGADEAVLLRVVDAAVVDDETTKSGKLTVAAQPTAVTGGLTIERLISAASTNATSVKASAGQVYGWYIFNENAAVRYLKLYNKASAPTVGTDTPVMTIPIPAEGGANVEFTNGIAFDTGIAFALTTGIADSNTGAVAADEIAVNLFYK